jgi:high-affinity iron transporter
MMPSSFDSLAHADLRLGAVAALLILLPAGPALAQQAGSDSGDSAHPEDATDRAGRVASLLELAATEYADAVADGEVINEAEYEETREFTREAGRVFEALDGRDAPGEATVVTASVDSLLSIVELRGPVVDFDRHVRNATEALASGWGAITVPEPASRPSAARGAELYRTSCASCHGTSGRGDGPAAEGLEPPPADFTAPIRTHDATPARDFQVTTLGIPATEMAGYADLLDVQQRWDLAAYLQTFRFGAAAVAEGKAVALGEEAEGPVADRLRAWASVEDGGRLTDVELRNRVQAAWRETEDSRDVAGSPRAATSSGGAETSGAATGDSLTTDQAHAVVAYVRSLMGTSRAGVPEPDRGRRLAASVDRADSLVRAAAQLAEAREHERARSTALQGYMAFEGVEPDLRSRSSGLVQGVERSFATFRQEVSRARGENVEPARDELLGLLSEARAELTSSATVWSLATQSFFIIVREGFEAILIIGALLAFLAKTGHDERRRDVYWGVGSALLASVATAFVLQRMLAATPASREAIEGVTMLVAVIVLFSVSYWLLSKLEHEKWEKYLRTKMQRALGAGGGLALVGVAFLAVYREGFETVLFYQALIGFSEGALTPVVGGFLVGCVALAVIYLLFTRFSVRMPMRPFFGVTSGVLYYMAVVFAGSGVSELQEAGWIGTTYLEGVPTIELLGLHPTVETLAAQAALLGLLAVALWVTFGRRRPVEA